MWVVFWGVLLKGFIQQEIGRYTVSTGKTITEGLGEIPGPRLRGRSWFLWVIIILLAITILVIVAGIGGAIGGVLAVLAPALGANSWGTVAMLSIVPILLLGTFSARLNVYSYFEKIMTGIIALLSVVMIYLAFIALPTFSEEFSYSFTDLLAGMGFGLPAGSTLVALAVLGGIGAGIELIFYSPWLKSKGYVANAYVGTDTAEERAQRVGGWVRMMQYDTWLGVAATMIISLAYFVTGAVVLNTLGLVPDGVEVVADVASIVTETIGEAWFYLFMVAAFAGLFSTALGIADGTARMTADLAEEYGFVARGRDPRIVYRATVVVVVAAWIVFYRLVAAPTLLITVGQAALSLVFPLYALALLYLNRQVPAGHRMGWLTKVALALSFLLFTSVWFIQAAAG